MLRHAFRNALIPITTLAALDFGAVIGGAIITETVFGWKGMGQLFRQALPNFDVNQADGLLRRGRDLGAGLQPVGRPDLRVARPGSVRLREARSLED